MQLLNLKLLWTILIDIVGRIFYQCFIDSTCTAKFLRIFEGWGYPHSNVIEMQFYSVSCKYYLKNLKRGNYLNYNVLLFTWISSGAPYHLAISSGNEHLTHRIDREIYSRGTDDPNQHPPVSIKARGQYPFQS